MDSLITVAARALAAGDPIGALNRSSRRDPALALGASQRTVQRALDALAAAGKVQQFGRGRARHLVG